MNEPKVTRLSSWIWVIGGGIIFALIFLCWFSWGASNAIVGIGLLFDIVGALLLAVPDIPQVHRRSFFSGKLKASLKHLNPDKLGEEVGGIIERSTAKELYLDMGLATDPEFEGILNDVDGYLTSEGYELESEGFYQLRKAMKDIPILDKRVETWEDVYGAMTYREKSGLHAVIMARNEGSPEPVIRGPYSMLFGPVEERTKELESQLRGFGFSLIVVGFSLQLVSMTVPQIRQLVV